MMTIGMGVITLMGGYSDGDIYYDDDKRDGGMLYWLYRFLSFYLRCLNIP